MLFDWERNRRPGVALAMRHASWGTVIYLYGGSVEIIALTMLHTVYTICTRFRMCYWHILNGR